MEAALAGVALKGASLAEAALAEIALEGAALAEAALVCDLNQGIDELAVGYQGPPLCLWLHVQCKGFI